MSFSACITTIRLLATQPTAATVAAATVASAAAAVAVAVAAAAAAAAAAGRQQQQQQPCGLTVAHTGVSYAEMPDIIIGVLQAPLDHDAPEALNNYPEDCTCLCDYLIEYHLSEGDVQ